MHLASTYFAEGHLAHASVSLSHAHLADGSNDVLHHSLTPPDAAHLSPRAATKLALWRPWLLLTLALSVTGSFWAFDLPGQLNVPLGERFGFTPDEWQLPFGRLYAVYALPNIVMPFIAGLVTWGIRQVSYAEVVVGRFLLGVGGESLSVARPGLPAIGLFLENELGFALGFHLAFARMGSVLNDLFTASIESTSGATTSSASALSVCLASMLFGVIACLIDGHKRPTVSESDLVHFDHSDDEEEQQEVSADDWRVGTGEFKPTLSPLPEHAPLSPIAQSPPSEPAHDSPNTTEASESTPLLGHAASRTLSASYSGSGNPLITSPYRRARVSSLTPSYRSLSGGSLLDTLHQPVTPLVAPTTTLVRRRSMSILVDVKDVAGSGADQMGLAAVAAASHAGASAAAAAVANFEVSQQNGARPPSVSAGSIFERTGAPDATIVLGFTPRPSLSATPSIMTLPLPTAALLDSCDDAPAGRPRFVLLTFPLSFWALTLSMVSLYVSCNTFTSISSDFLQSKYAMNATQAGKMNSLMDIMATVVVPASGLLFERLPRWGQRTAVVVNAMGLACAFAGLAWSDSVEYLYVALGLLGSAYAIGASMLWPLIPILVRDPSTLSTAYGVVTCGVNGMLAIVPAFFAGLIAADPSFTTTMLTFSGIAGVGAVAAMLT
ncbi:major facilitator superfamily domain-containing protein [Catenaria anguillulae PL171]|uniref:Major facilitator superfamily domain-containing protein n=1 Tax=Catenaria anguillulae PL171 TaxID=765915 RepID=A0A1Y2HGI0_9FUNG|nr:major facilitator superfamily domain-containing protein [Catenaria anguillulae PL171]